jgi:hypothetical protein
MLTPQQPGILRKSSGFGVFAKIFSKNIVIPSKEIPFFGEAPKMVLGNYRQIWFLQCSSDEHLESPNSAIRVTRLTEYPNIRLFG